MPMDKQKWNPAQYAEEAHFVSELGAQVVDLLAPCAGERILDLGCGDGTLAKALHDAGCRVVGVDASPEMVAAAISTEWMPVSSMGMRYGSMPSSTPCFPTLPCTG